MTLAGQETQSHGPSTVSTRWRTPSSKNTFTFPSRMKKISSTSCVCAALPSHGGPGARGAGEGHARGDTAPAGVALLRDARVLAALERGLDVHAGRGVARDFERDVLSEEDAALGQHRIPVDAFHRHVLADGAWNDGVAFALQIPDALHREEADGALGAAVDVKVPLTIALDALLRDARDGHRRLRHAAVRDAH